MSTVRNRRTHSFNWLNSIHHWDMSTVRYYSYYVVTISRKNDVGMLKSYTMQSKLVDLGITLSSHRQYLEL